MKPRDRLITVLEKREPDRIPIVLQTVLSSRVFNELLRIIEKNRKKVPTNASQVITYRMVQEFSNRILKDNPSSWKEEFERTVNFVAMAPVNVSLYARLDVDGFFYPATPGKITMIDQNHFVNEFGSISEFGDANGELINWYSGGYLKTPEQRDHWPLPQPSPERVEAYAKALRAYGDKVYPIGFVVGIFELTWQAMGFTEFALYLKTNPSFVHRVYEEHARFAEELAKLFIDAGAEIIGIGDDVAYKNNLMVSPKMWSEYVQPLASRIVNTIHKRGGLVFMHSDGYVTPLMDLIIRTGYDGIQSLEPNAGVKLREVKEAFGEKIALIGGIDTSQLLPFGTEKDVEEAVKEAIGAAGMRGGYAIGPCTEIHWKCKPENVLAMIRYARKYGAYPLKTR